MTLSEENEAIAGHLVQQALILARYDLVPDNDGENRRQRNIRFGEVKKNPLFRIDPDAKQLWDWFRDIDRQRQQADGMPQPVTFSDLYAWSKLTPNEPDHEQLEILRRIDSAFCHGIAEECDEVRSINAA